MGEITVNRLSQIAAAALSVAWIGGSALAAPPASCASKFVGTWSYPGGTTTVMPNGLAYPHCPMCVAVQTWTCQGNTYLFSNSGPPGQFSATLIDANHVSGAGRIATRISGGAAGAKKTPQQQASSPAESAPAPRSASCSDITGLGGGGAAARTCKTGNSLLSAARAIRAKDPRAAADKYKQAAEAYRRAGDARLAKAVLAEAPKDLPSDKPGDRGTGPSPAQGGPEIGANDACAVPMREASGYIIGAEAIEKNDATCAGLMSAAENYFQAGKIFLGALKPGSPEETENACAYQKTNEMWLKRDGLIARVDKMRQDGLCDSARGGPGPVPPAGGSGGGPNGPNDACKENLQKLAEAQAYATKNNLAEVELTLDAKTVEVAAQGCRAGPLDAQTCNRAAFYWGQYENLGKEAIAARRKAAGCPPG